jgi:hypothetical protein
MLRIPATQDPKSHMARMVNHKYQKHNILATCTGFKVMQAIHMMPKDILSSGPMILLFSPLTMFSGSTLAALRGSPWAHERHWQVAYIVRFSESLQLMMHTLAGVTVK